MKGKHNQRWPKGMSFSAGLLHLGCCKNWKQQINFPKDWEYNPLTFKWVAKEGTKYFMTASALDGSNKVKTMMRILDRDLAILAPKKGTKE